MKLAFCAVVTALLAVSAIQGGETAAIEGKVLLAQTGEPVSGATVVLLETGGFGNRRPTRGVPVQGAAAGALPSARSHPKLPAGRLRND